MRIPTMLCVIIFTSAHPALLLAEDVAVWNQEPNYIYGVPAARPYPNKSYIPADDFTVPTDFILTSASVVIWNPHPELVLGFMVAITTPLEDCIPVTFLGNEHDEWTSEFLGNDFFRYRIELPPLPLEADQIYWFSAFPYFHNYPDGEPLPRWICSDQHPLCDALWTHTHPDWPVWWTLPEYFEYWEEEQVAVEHASGLTFALYAEEYVAVERATLGQVKALFRQ